MPFVKTKFDLPTVSRADGSLAGLGDYVQYSGNPTSTRFVWPAERIAIYQAQQAAKLQAAKKKKMFSLFDIFSGSSSPTPSPAARPGKKGVQTSATLGLVTAPAGPAGDIATAVWQAGPNATFQDAVTQFMANLNAARSNIQRQAPDATPKPDPNSQSLVSGVPKSALYIGGALVAGGVLIAIAKGGRR